MRTLVAARFGVALLALMALSSPAAPLRINHQGRLLDSAGAPLNGTVTLQFGLFAFAAGHSALWTETQTGVVAVDGVYSVELGSVTPLDAALFAGGDRWLEVSANGETLTPRQHLTSVPYALRAQTLDGPALPSLETLQGVPCRVGTPSVGTTQVIFSAGGQSPVSLACVPSNIWTLTVTVNRTGPYQPGNSAGARVDAPGITCTGQSGEDCSGTYPGGTTVTLTESNTLGFVFLGWSGGCAPNGATCVTTMDAAKSVTASFNCPLASLCAGF